MSELTAKQSRFVAEYLIDLNATAAYKRAGYAATGNAAEVSACQLLRVPKVAALIQAEMDKRAARVEVTQDYVLLTIIETIERCKQARPVLLKDGKPVMVTTPDGEIAPVYSYDASAVLKGAELLGKHLKLFTDKVEHGGSIAHTLTDAELDAKIKALR